MRPQFAKYGNLQRRKDKIAALDELNTSDSRKARKQMNEFKVRQGRTNVNGFFGSQKIKCKAGKKSRGVKLSPQLRLAMAGRL